MFRLSFPLWQKLCRIGAQRPPPRPVTNEVLSAGTCYPDTLSSGLTISIQEC